MNGGAGSDFDRFGYAVIRGLVPRAMRAFLHDYGLTGARMGKLVTRDKQIPGTPASYGDPLMEGLLDVLRSRVETESGRSLFPTYSYFRVYRPGDVLHRHTDRPACEVSLTVSLGGDCVWPIWIQPEHDPVEIRLDPGDGLLYQGIRVPHWREAFEGQYAVQAFLHYVDQSGPHRSWIFDKREQLAVSPAARAILQRLR